MQTKTWRYGVAHRVLSGLLTAAPLAVVSATPVLLAGEAMAQSAVGGVYGRGQPGAQVTLTDKSTGVTRTGTANASGQFSFNQIAPGDYEAKSGAVTRVVSVRAGFNSEVSLISDDTVVVVASGSVNPIDVKSVESSAVFTSSQLENLPVARELSSVALLAPGTVLNGAPGSFGNTVSVGGSSVAENGYYINGFDVTNIRTFLSYADLPYDAVGQQQVKTGGYGAEYGRSLGGVISLVTKRGGNDWKWGGSISLSPQEWAMDAKDALSRDPQNIASGDKYLAFRSKNRSDSKVWTNYVSGPVINDMLFVYGAVQLQDVRSDTYGRNTSTHVEYDSPQYIGKVDFYPLENHHFEYTGIVNKDLAHVTDYEYSSPGTYIAKHEDKTGAYDVESGGEVHIFKYTGQWLDNLTVSVQHGQLENVNNAKVPALPDVAGGLCVAAYDSRGNASALNKIGCWNESFFTIPDLQAGKERDNRKADRVDVDYTLGDHNIRFGYDKETFDSSKVGETYSGGAYWRYYQRATAFTVNGVSVPANTLYGRKRVYGTGSSTYEVENTAWYIEDSWQFSPNILLYGGLRSESFTNYNSLGEAFVSADNLIAPRLGVSWDVDGDSSFKVFANAGRYYIPVATNTNIRASGVEFLEEQFFLLGGVNTATGLPTSIGSQIGATNLNGSKTPPEPFSVASKNLEPMFQDEFIVGAQKQLNDDLVVGVRAIHRQVNNGMDDHCSYGPYQKWAADKGYTNFDYHTVAGCQIINPGKDVVLQFDRNNTGTATDNLIPASYFKLPEYKRTYDAIEVFGEYRGENWSVNGSYTLSRSQGNVEGYVNTSLGQVDAGLTQDFDNYLFENGADGPLPNDRTHVLKVFGNYDLTSEWSLGGNLLVQSGRPVNCFGFVDLNDPGLTAADRGQLAFYSASSFYCSRADGSKFLSNRGDFGRTDWLWNFDMQVAYVPEAANGAVGFYLDIRNLFNLKGVTQVQERSQKGTSAAQEYSPDFLSEVGYQNPRRLTLTMRYNF